MSTIGDAVECYATGREYNLPPSMDNLSFEMGDSTCINSPAPVRMKEWRIKIRWGYEFRCLDEDKDRMMQRFVAEFKHELYKDLYQPMMDIERGLYEHDRDMSQEGVNKMRSVMYGGQCEG